MSITREDKREICEKLLQALQATRHMDELVDLEYSGMLTCGEEYVTALFRNGSRKTINVTCDSGYALIQDVMEGLK